MIKTNIVNTSTGHEAEVDHTAGEVQALAVATRPLKTFTNGSRFFTSADFGSNLNQNGSFGGVPDKVHDGIDNVLWTATDIVGGAKTTFNSTDQNHTGAGSTSVKVDNSPVNDVYQFSKGSDLDMTGFTALTMWIYVDKDWDVADDVEAYGWDTGTGLQVGTAVSLQDYFNFLSFDVWQKIVIPLTDMGTLASYTTLDALRVRQTDTSGKAPKYYLDDIQFEQTGTPIEFILEPDAGTWLHISNTTYSVADVFTSGIANDTMPRLPYDTFLGETLTSGLTFQRIDSGITFSATIMSLMDLMQFSKASIQAGADGTNTWFTVNIPTPEMAPVILKSEEMDSLKIIISDDLTGLLHLRVAVGAIVEQRIFV